MNAPSFSATRFATASLSVITVTLSSLPHLIGTVVIVEVVFSWPGVGNLMAQSVMARDYPVVFLDVILFSVLTVRYVPRDGTWSTSWSTPRVRHR